MRISMPTTRTRWLLVIVLNLLTWPDALPAAESAEKPPDTPSLSNVRRQGWIQFTLNSGRIVVAGSRGVNFSHTGLMRSDRGEQLSIRVNSNEPVMAYELRTPTYRILLDVLAGRRLQIRRLPRGDGAESLPVEFQQSPGEPLALTVGVKENQRAYRAESLWHLFLAEPAPARQYLAPLLKILLPEWDFVKTSEEIESILVHTAQSGPPPDRKLWAEWVRQLGDPSFAKREQADRKLRDSGRVVATYLRQLNPARLDAEQRYRVTRILSAMSNLNREELPPQLAAWLSGDPSIWLALLSRQSDPTRQAAMRRLEALSGGPVVFEPTADEATRQRQIDAIRARVLQHD